MQRISSSAPPALINFPPNASISHWPGDEWSHRSVHWGKRKRIRTRYAKDRSEIEFGIRKLTKENVSLLSSLHLES